MNKSDLDHSGTVLYLRENTEELKRFNQRQNNQAQWLKALVLLGYLGFMFLLWLVVYVIRNNVVNNIVARCI